MVKKLLAAFSLSLCSIASAHAAGITNGGFESGNLDGWSVFIFDRYSELAYAPPDHWGYAAAVGASALGRPLDGTYSALLAAMDYGRNSCSYDIFSPLCASYPPTGVPSTLAGGPALAYPLPPFITGRGYNGAYIGQDFTAAAGDLLAWTWKGGGDGTDFMFAVLTNGVSGVYLDSRAFGSFLAEVDLATGRLLWSRSSTDLAPGQTWDASFRIPTDGPWTIYYGIEQMADNQGSSWMWLDNVRVPEPATAGLLAVGLLSLLVVHRTRRGSVKNAPQFPFAAK